MGVFGDAWDWTKDKWGEAADSDFSWVDVAVPFWGATHAALKGGKALGNAFGAGIGGSDGNGGDDYTGGYGPNFQYGGDPYNPNPIVSDATRGAFSTGAAAASLGRDATKFGQGAAAQGSSILDQRGTDAQRFDQRTVQQGDFGAQNQSLGALGGLEATQGPSAAQAQLQSGTNQAMASQLAMARSGRGFGGNAAAMGLAQGNMAGIQANQANAASQLRAQEDAAWRQRQAGNLTNVAGMQGQQAQANLGAAVQGRSQNDAMYQGMLGLGQNAWQTGIGAGMEGYNVGMQGYGASLDGQRLATDIRGQEMSGNQAFEDAKLRAWAAEQGYDLQQQAASDQKDAATIAAASSLASSYATRSDVRAKKDITRSDEPALDFARAGSMVSPAAPDTEALDAVAQAPGYGYKYTDPGAPGANDQENYGPMAQDLAATPAGSTAVTKMGDGQLGIDPNRLSLVNTSAISAQQRQLDQIMAELEAFKSQSGAQYPSRGSY
jgi:hypothetical protein